MSEPDPMAVEYGPEWPPESCGLALENFRLLAAPNARFSGRSSHVMVWYREWLYLATGQIRPGFLGGFRAGQPQGEGRRGIVREPDSQNREGVQIWRLDPAREIWEKVFGSPLEETGSGRVQPRFWTVWAGLAYRTAMDAESALYFCVGLSDGTLVFVRSTDGRNFEECGERGFGLPDADMPCVYSVCGLTGRLYTAPVGSTAADGMLDDGMTDYPVILETGEMPAGDWMPVNEPAFEDMNNLAVTKLVIFNGQLYAATVNTRRGAQLWRADVQGEAPCRWRKVLDDGAWRGPANSICTDLCVFDGALYVSLGMKREERPGLDRYGPFGAELLRVHTDDSWDIVCGVPRFTPAGLKRPLSGRDAGFDDRFVHSFHRLCEYGGFLYAATGGWRWLPTYLWGRKDLTESQRQYLQIETAKTVEGEMGLWRSADGLQWEALTQTGFAGGRSGSYYVEDMIGTPFGLFVIPVCSPVDEAGGGFEIWWGAAP